MPEKPATHVIEPAKPAPEKPKPLAPGDFVTRKGGHPDRGDLPDEPVGRIVVVEPLVDVVLGKDGKPALDEAGVVRTKPAGERLYVTWPRLRVESRHAADELQPHGEPGP